MVLTCERLAAERMAASGEDDQRFCTESSIGAVLRVRVRVRRFRVRVSLLLDVRLRAATLTDVVGLFRRASDRLGDDSRVSISSTGALAVCFSLFYELTPITDPALISPADRLLTVTIMRPRSR